MFPSVFVVFSVIPPSLWSYLPIIPNLQAQIARAYSVNAKWDIRSSFPEKKIGILQITIKDHTTSKNTLFLKSSPKVWTILSSLVYVKHVRSIKSNVRTSMTREMSQAHAHAFTALNYQKRKTVSAIEQIFHLGVAISGTNAKLPH